MTNRVLQVLLNTGFRLAERGEFSKRAFLNQKLDLTQAEAIMDIISANNSLALKSSANSLRSSTSKLIHGFRDKLLDLLAKIEVNIDYPEYEDAVEVTHEFLEPILGELLRDMEVILDNSSISTIAIHGLKTAIVGKPNVGKSSLLNMLLDEDKAIVSSVAGTTRDFVEGSLNIRNITLHLIDTAGIHHSTDDVEAIGIERSKKAIASADLVLLVLDSSRPLEEEDYLLLKITEQKKRVIIANKADLEPSWKMEESIGISTKQGKGLEALADKIYEITNIHRLNIDEGKFLNNQRQVSLMSRAYQSLKNALCAAKEGVDIDLIEIDIKQAFDSLGEITGEAYPDELITALFTKFCLGK